MEKDDTYDDPTSTLSVPVDFTVFGPSSPPREHEETDSAPEEADLGNDEDFFSQEWHASLYMLQSQAPMPHCISSDKEIDSCQPYYGKEFHGYLHQEEVANLLGNTDGSYLVKETLTGMKVLSFLMNGRVYNYRLYYEDGLHYVGENHFESIEELVQDGLISLYLQQYNVAQTIYEGRLNSLARRVKAEKKLQQLKRTDGKRVKGLKGKEAWNYHRTISEASLSSANSPSPTPSPSQSPTLSPQYILSENKATTSHIQTDKTVHDPNAEESDLDFVQRASRRSAPNMSRSMLNEQRRTNSVSSLPITPPPSKDRFSVIISTLRDAVNEDKKKVLLKLDNSSRKLKTCSSEGKIGKSFEGRSSKLGDPRRTYSYNAPFASSLERIADCSIKGTNTFSRSSMEALAKHTSGPKSPYYKAHSFIGHTFYKALVWCEICHHFLWGLKHHGMRCKDCGMDIHKQCLPLALQLECYPNKKFVKRVYGVDLTTLVKLEGGVIPNILRECMNEIQSRDLSFEGIYRVSGQTSEILDLKEKYDTGESVDLSQYLDVNVLTGVIKLYLRELPIPLITFDSYKEIIKATVVIVDSEDSDIDWHHFRNALKLLPKAHYNTLRHLAQHLNKVQLKCAENKMTARNLSVVFAPTLMRSPDESSSLIKDLPLQRNLIEYLILNYDIIFI